MTKGEDLFASLLDQAADVRQHQVSDAPNATYISYLKSYEKCMLADFKKDPSSLISRLRQRLEMIGVEDPAAYSWHSFRRGAAFLASRKGVQDCVIKKHGRWSSDAYIRYVSVEAVRAGREVYVSLTE